MMAEIDNSTEKWYVIGTRAAHREEKTRDALRKAGFRSHVPMTYDIKTVRQQKRRTIVPAITGLIFARGSLNDLKDYISQHPGDMIYIRKSTFSNKQDYLTVRDDVMERFIECTQIRQEKISYFKPEELNLKEGENIRIKGGLYDGLEGTILRIKGKRNKHIVVQIPGIIFAAIEIEPELIEINESHEDAELKERPSKDVDGDKKYLLETAEWLLENQNDKDVPKVEYNLKLVELKRTRARLLKFKGFTPTTEAELALPMYMAAVILNDQVDTYRQRLQKATDKLKNTSKLKIKCTKILTDYGND